MTLDTPAATAVAGAAASAAVPARPAAAPAFLKQLKRFTWGHVIFLSVLVGVVSGLGGVAFNFLVDTADRYARAALAGYVAPRAGAEGGNQPAPMPPRRWVLLVMPGLGGLLAGLLV